MYEIIKSLCIRYEAIKCFEAVILCNNNRDINKNINTINAVLNGVMPLLCHLLTKMDDSTLKYLLKYLSLIIKYYS